MHALTLDQQEGKCFDTDSPSFFRVGVYLKKALRDKETPMENMPKVNSSSMYVEKDLEAFWEDSTISPEKERVGRAEYDTLPMGDRAKFQFQLHGAGGRPLSMDGQRKYSLDSKSQDLWRLRQLWYREAGTQGIPRATAPTRAVPLNGWHWNKTDPGSGRRDGEG